MATEAQEASDPHRPMFGDPCGPWFRVFAWMPVDAVDAGTTWMRWVWKRRIYKHQYLDGGGPDFWFQYRRFNYPNRLSAQGRMTA